MPRKTKSPKLSRADVLWLKQAGISLFEVFLGCPNDPAPDEPCDHPWHYRPASAAKRRKNSGHDYHTWRAAEECNAPNYCDECGGKHRGGNTVYCPECGCNNLGNESPNRAIDVTIAGIRFPFVSTLTPETIEAELAEVSSYLRESRILDWKKEDFGVNGNEQDNGDDDENDLTFTDWLLAGKRQGRYFMGCGVGSPRPAPRYPEDYITPEGEWRIIQKERQRTYFTCRRVEVEESPTVFTDFRSEDERQIDEDNRRRTINQVLKDGCCS